MSPVDGHPDEKKVLHGFTFNQMNALTLYVIKDIYVIHNNAIPPF